ncbi:MAG: ABC transporter substrate-binding protein, partial [Bacilli bacterium]
MKKYSLIIVCMLVLSILISGCTGNKTNPSAGNETDVIKIGWFGPLTGPTATDGTNSRDAAQLAVEQ